MIDFSSDSVADQSQVWVVAACFNEETVICKFVERVIALPEVSHLLLVDDGSRDGTVANVRAWQQRFVGSKASAQVTLLELTRNFGKEAAMLAGLDYAQEIGRASCRERV